MLGVSQARARLETPCRGLQKKSRNRYGTMTLATDTTDTTGDDPRASLALWDYRRRVHDSYQSARQGVSSEEA